MRSASVIAASLVLCLYAEAQNPKVSDAKNIGFNGPVHTVSIKIEKLAEDPRHDRGIYPGYWCGACTFDPQGGFLARSDINAADGSLSGAIRFTRDDQGRVTEQIGADAQGQTVSRVTYTMGPLGPLEEKTWIQGKLAGWATSTCDQNGNQLTTMRYDSSGTLVWEGTWRYDEEGRVLELISAGQSGQFDREERRYDEDGNLLEMGDHDRDGNAQMQAVFQDGHLVSWWLKPDANFGIGFGEPTNKDGVSVSYSSRADGQLEKYVTRSAGRDGNADPDEALHYSPQGKLIERVSYRYKWDSMGNWTEREIRVRNMATGSDILTERDYRYITYY